MDFILIIKVPPLSYYISPPLLSNTHKDAGKKSLCDYLPAFQF